MKQSGFSRAVYYTVPRVFCIYTAGPPARPNYTRLWCFLFLSVFSHSLVSKVRTAEDTIVFAALIITVDNVITLPQGSGGHSRADLARHSSELRIENSPRIPERLIARSKKQQIGFLGVYSEILFSLLIIVL